MNKQHSYHDHDPYEVNYSEDKHEPDLFLSSLPKEKAVYALITGGEVLQVCLMTHDEYLENQQAADFASDGNIYWALYQDPIKAAEIERLRGLLEMYLKYNDDYALSGADMRRMLDNIWLPKVRAALEKGK